MTPDLALALLSIVCAVIAWVCADVVRRSNKRRRKEQEAMQARADEVRDRVAVALAAAVGQYPIKQCRVSDIKYGDTVCWRSDDWQQHTDYVAGYDGDPGPSADGFHGKPIVLKGL